MINVTSTGHRRARRSADRRSLGVTLLALVSSTPLAAQRPAAQWVGGFSIGRDWRFLRLRLPSDSSAGGGAASVDLPRPEACTMGVPLERVDRGSSRLQFRVRTDGGLLSFDGRFGGGPDSSIRGTVTRGGEQGPFRLARLGQLDPQTSKSYASYVGNYQLEGSGRTVLVTEIDGLPVYLDSLRFAKLHPLSDSTFFTDDGELLSFKRGAGGKVAELGLESWDGRRSRGIRVARYREERVSYPSGKVTLGGTVLTPLGRGRFPAVVMVHGSNAQPREGYRFLGGDYFARHGIATLIYDKRGVGESTGEWRRASLDTLAGDALAGVRMLKSRPDIDPDRIGLYGISQGGWIIPLAAARSSEVAFLISVAGNVIMLWEQEMLRQLAELKAGGASDALVAEADTTWRLFFRLLRAGKGTQRADSAVSLLRKHDIPTPHKSTEIGPNAWFNFLDPFHDPMAVLRRVRQPTLWMFGEIDLITPVKPNLERLEPFLRQDPRPNHTIKVFPKANHMIWRGVTGSGREIACLREIDPGYFTTMVEWIGKLPPWRAN